MCHRMIALTAKPGAIYYNSRHFGKTRNEKGLPAGVEAAHFRDPENTGALTLLAFKLDEQGGTVRK